MILHTEVSDLFRSNGAKIVAEEYVFAENLKSIKALIFDWDGVFNEGWKGDNVLSPFSEVDSMGINMLRFALWLKSRIVPQVFIVTGLKNLSAQAIANREGFTALYLEVMNKSKAVEHIEANYGLTQKEMICFFDDILDIPMVKDCALRMFIHRKSNPLFERYVVENNLCDYVTGTESGKPAIREACEFLLGMGGMYDETISKRISFSDEFKQFMSERKEIKPSLFRFNGTDIEPYQG
jgi:3-deoxy-D-manno-octulosonate 8-phosphate phosphatase (KDO 8-P phosphatase)